MGTKRQWNNEFGELATFKQNRIEKRMLNEWLKNRQGVKQLRSIFSKKTHTNEPIQSHGS